MPSAYCQNCREERVVLFASATAAHCGECGRPLSLMPDRRTKRRRFARETEAIRAALRGRSDAPGS